MNPQLMRKYLDILNEQYEPPGGYPKDAPQFVKDLDTAFRTGEGPGAEQMNQMSRNDQAMVLRNVGAWVNRDSEVQQGMNPGARVYNPNQQDIDSREAGQQAMLDRQTDPVKKAELLKTLQSRDINKPFFTTAEPTKTDATDPKTVKTAPVKPAPAPVKPAAPVKAAPVVQPAAAPVKSEPFAAPVDFTARSGTVPVADTGLGKLSGGLSLGGSAGNYLDPQLRAELANQSGGKFTADVGQSGQQFGYEQQFGDKARGQLAVRQTAGGGTSVGVGGSYDITPNLKLTGGVSRDIKGQGGDRADIGLRYNFPESTKNLKRK